MTRFIIAILFCICLLAQLACSGGTSENKNSAEVIPQAAPYADITDANQALEIGNKLLEDNDTEKAINAFLRAVELNPDLAEAYFKMGIAYSLVEREQEMSSNTNTETEQPGDANTSKHPQRDSEKAFRKAIEAYKKILAENPNDDVANFNLGRAYNKLNEDQDAAKALKQAVKLKPDDGEYQTELGAILIKLAQYREAIPPLKKALELDAENSRAQDLLDDAEAGRSRVDYVPPKKGEGNSNSNVNSNANLSTGANSNTDRKPPSDTKKPETKDKKANPSVNKPN